jgi:hypothetical protein
MNHRVVKTALLACGILAGASAVSLVVPAVRDGKAAWLDADWWRGLLSDAIARIQPVVAAVPPRLWILSLIGTATLAGILLAMRRFRRKSGNPAAPADRRAMAHRLVASGKSMVLVSRETGLAQDAIRAMV